MRKFILQKEYDEPLKISVTIYGLWGSEDVLHLTLNEDVTILSGINGSGKSTILNILYFLLSNDLSNDTRLRIEHIEEKYETDTDVPLYKQWEVISAFKKVHLTVNTETEVIDNVVDSVQPYSDIGLSIKNKIDFLAAIDQKLVSREDIEAITRKNKWVKSQLDYELYNHQVEYTKYLLSISKEVEKAYLNQQQNKLMDIYAPKLLFFELLDNLFAPTNKQVNRDADELQFIKDGKTELTVYQLSSGEKQMVLILLKALLQRQKWALYFLDEPEISLHINWQETLIDNILKINPNAQLIIATHSPDLIINGWQDKVIDISQITTNNIV